MLRISRGIWLETSGFLPIFFGWFATLGPSLHLSNSSSEKKGGVILTSLLRGTGQYGYSVFSRDKYDPNFSSTGSQQARETAGQSVPERQAKTHLQDRPSQNKDRLKGKQAAISRVLSEVSVGTPGLDQRLFVTFVELLQTLKKGQSRLASLILYSLFPLLLQSWVNRKL